MALGMGNYGRKGLFGKLVSPAPHEAQPMEQSMAAPMEQPQQQPKKPGFLGEGGAGRAIAGVLGDTLLQYNGMAPMYAPTMLQQQESEAKARQAQLQRAQDLADFETKEQIKSRYEGPPSIIQNADAIGAELGPEARQDYLRNYGRAPQQPNVVNIPGLGSFYGTPEEVTAAIAAARGGGRPAGASIAPGAVEDGFRFKGGDPKDQRNWEPVAGGPTQPASGNFPRVGPDFLNGLS